MHTSMMGDVNAVRLENMIEAGMKSNHTDISNYYEKEKTITLCCFRIRWILSYFIYLKYIFSGSPFSDDAGELGSKFNF